MFWNLHQPGGCFCLVSPPEPLVEALNRVAGSYWAELVGAMRRRLGGTQLRDGRRFLPRPGGVPGAGGRRRALRREPFFFDWFGGIASEERALKGPRAPLYGGEHFKAFRALLAGREMQRPERLAHIYFTRLEPEELLYDEIEALWLPISTGDDWSAFNGKLASIEEARQAWAYSPPNGSF